MPGPGPRRPPGGPRGAGRGRPWVSGFLLDVVKLAQGHPTGGGSDGPLRGPPAPDRSAAGGTMAKHHSITTRAQRTTTASLSTSPAEPARVTGGPPPEPGTEPAPAAPDPGPVLRPEDETRL